MLHLSGLQVVSQHFSFFSHWDPATLLSLCISRRQARVCTEPQEGRKGRVGRVGGSLGPGRREACGGPAAGASHGGKAGEGREGFRRQLGGPELMGRIE